MPALTTIQLRRGSSSLWAASNSPLAQGELGYDTTIKKFKIGDGTSLWSSLSWANITGADFVGTSGINVSYASASGTMTVSVTGLSSSYLSDFSSAVSGLLPVKSIIAGSNITVTPTGDKGFVISSPVNSDTVKDLIGSTITGVSGIRASYDNTSKVETISVTGLTSSYISDFNTSVSGLVSGVYAPLTSPALTGTPTAPTAAADTNTTQIASTAFVIGQASSSNPLMDGTVAVGTSKKYARADHVHPTDTTRAALAGATFTGAVSIPSGTGNFNTLTVNSTAVSLNGHTHTSSNITDFNTAVSGLLGVKSLVQGSGIGITNNAGAQTISITGIPSSLITDLGNIATTQVIGRTGIALSYDAVSDTMYIDTTGVSFSGHTHSWSNITDASTKATLTELSYLSGVVPGTASSGRALVVDNSKNLTGINTLTTVSDVIVGGNLTVQGTTTTVNSSTINIGDNIIRVNTSGLSTGGMEVYTGSTTQSIVWNNVSNRWEFSGGNVYTSGNFIGNLSGNASTVTNGVYTTDTGTVTSAMIADNTIVNADINSSAAISYSKLNLSSSIVNADISNSAAIADSKLATISTAGKVSNSATTATNANTASAIVSRDASGNFSAGTITANLSGNATSVTNGVYTTDTGTVTSTMIADNTIVNADINSAAAIAYSKLNLSASIVNADIGAAAAIAYSKLNLSSGIVNSDISASAAIVDTKLATISTSGKVSNSATTATSSNTASAIVARDASGNFTAGTITASLSGNATSVTNGVYTTDTGTVTNTMLAGSIANSKLLNSSVIIGSTAVSLGSTVTAFSGLSTVTATTFIGSLSGTANNVVTNANLTGPITSIGNATTISTGVIDNSHISSTGAIAYSKLNLSSSIVNADVSSSAAIAYSKLNLAGNIVNADINAAASISYSKLNLSSSVTNSDVATNAAIAYSKLNLVSGITNNDISATGAIAYSKLNLSTSIVNADIAASAAIVDTKLATISTSGKVSNSATTATSANTASAIVARDASGNFTAGTITASLSGNATSVTNGVYTTDTGTVTNTMLAGSIANAKLLNSSVTLGSTSISLGGTASTIAGLTSISGVSAASPTTLVYCLIDGGTP
jgi:trimeric autotransporter adhesin